MRIQAVLIYPFLAALLIAPSFAAAECEFESDPYCEQEQDPGAAPGQIDEIDTVRICPELNPAVCDGYVTPSAFGPFSAPPLPLDQLSNCDLERELFCARIRNDKLTNDIFVLQDDSRSCEKTQATAGLDKKKILESLADAARKARRLGLRNKFLKRICG